MYPEFYVTFSNTYLLHISTFPPSHLPTFPTSHLHTFPPSTFLSSLLLPSYLPSFYLPIFSPSNLPIFLPFLLPIFPPSLLLPSYLPSFYLPTFPPSNFSSSLLPTFPLERPLPEVECRPLQNTFLPFYFLPSYLSTYPPPYLPTYNLPIPLPPYHPTFLLTFSPSYLPCRMTSTWGWGLASTKHCNSTSRLQFVTAVLWSKLTRGMSKQIIYKLTDRLTDCWLIDLLVNIFPRFEILKLMLIPTIIK